MFSREGAKALSFNYCGLASV